MPIRHLILALLSTPLALDTAHAQSTRAGFVTTLGRDTVALESYERTASRLEGDIMIRVPGTVHFHYVLDLRSNGTVSHSLLTMVPLGVTGLAAGRSSQDFPTDSSAVPFFMTGFDASFGLYSSLGIAELLVANMPVSAVDSVRISSVDIASARRTRHTLVRPSATSAAVDFFMIAWTRFTTDEHGRILTADMSETTEKTRSVRTDPIDVTRAAQSFAERDNAGKGLGVASPNEQVAGTIGGKAVLVSYGSPRKRGREILGTVVPYDKVWRTGANAATTLLTVADIKIGGSLLPAGSYSLWTVPTRSGVQLVINGQSGQWGTSYDPSKDVARVPMQMQTAQLPQEAFVITIVRTGNNSAELRIAWDTFVWTVPMADIQT
jgi:hypothetical protein